MEGCTIFQIVASPNIYSASEGGVWCIAMPRVVCTVHTARPLRVEVRLKGFVGERGIGSSLGVSVDVCTSHGSLLLNCTSAVENVMIRLGLSVCSFEREATQFRHETRC